MSVAAFAPEIAVLPTRPRLTLVPEFAAEPVSPLDARHDKHSLRIDLERERTRVEKTARHMGRVVGIRGTWGTSRWRAGQDGVSVVPTFEIQVAGTTPCARVAKMIGERLALAGWAGSIASLQPFVRIDARSGQSKLRLIAREQTVTLTYVGEPVIVGEENVQDVLDGIYAQEWD